jgi:hypothetical protein
MWALIQALWLAGSRSPREELQFDWRRMGRAILVGASFLIGVIVIAALILRLWQ